MTKLILATGNRGKVREFQELLASMAVEVISMRDAGIYTDINETGSTFEENALIKAREVRRITGGYTIADDSGLVVDSLDGAPGIYSSRFGGEGATDSEKNFKLLAMLKDVEPAKRTARFVCSIAFINKEGREFVVTGKCEGMIAFSPKGENGFGYDPIFFIPEYDKTMAQLEPELKNQISHRGRAMKALKDILKSELNLD